MTRKKSRLTLQQPKNLKKEQKLHKPPQLNLIRAIQFSPSPRTGKRKLLPSPFKSPNRIINSPLHKRVKLIGQAHRSLFACTTTQDDNENDWVYIEWEECDEFQFESKKAEKVLDLHGIDESKQNDIENIPCFTEGNSSNPEHDLVKTEWETKNDDELGGQIESKMCDTNLKIASGPEEMSDYATESKRCANETIPCCNETPEHETYFAELLEESTSNELNKESQEMVKLVPEVMRAFSEIGLQSELLTFFKQVKENKFPLTNIALLLWLDVVRWYDCETTTRMRYRKETKMFWKLGWRIFGGRFVNFMGGYKNHADTILGLSEKGSYSPQTSIVNFSVPDMKTLRAHDPYQIEGERRPGMYMDIMQTLGDNYGHTSACLTYDGKKIKQGLTDHSGDVDLLGFEDGDSLAQRHDALRKQIDSIQSFQSKLNNLHSGLQSVNLLPSAYQMELKTNLLETLKRTSENINLTMELKRKKEYCKEKLVERSGDCDWRKGKFVYAISAIIAFLYDIEVYLKSAAELKERLCRCISFLNGSSFVIGEHLNLNESLVYSTSEECERNDPTPSSRYTKQRSSEWHTMRDKAKITGSTLFAAVGAGGLNRLKDHFDKVICGVPEKEHTAEVKALLQHGIDNEENAVATVVGKVMPVIEPDLVFCEEGCIEIFTEHGEPFMVVSPDGSLRSNRTLTATKVAIELKCPVNKPHTEFPPRYLLQCLSEIEALDADYLIYASWTQEETAVFKVKPDKSLLQKALGIAYSTYATENPKKPTRLSPEMRELKTEIYETSKHVKFVGNFGSIRSENVQTRYATKPVDTKDVSDLFESVTDLTYKHFELNRQRASEAVVFLAADLDRGWDKDKLKCAPVAWFPKGYSLQTETLRKIAEEVHTQCHKFGVHIPSESFDGQWHGLVVRTSTGDPLTVLQLQKDVWKETEKMSKSEILGLLKNINKCPVIVVHEAGNKVIEATNDGIRLPKYRPSMKKVSKKEEKKEKEQLKETTTLADVVPEVVVESSEANETVLAMTDIDNIELEAFMSNVDEDEWSREMDEINNTETEQYVTTNSFEPQTEPKTDKHGALRDIDSSTRSDVQHNIYVDLNDAKKILALFKTTKDCNKKNKWDDVNAEDLMARFTSIEKLKTLLDVEMRVVVRYLKKAKGVSINESSSKQVKVSKLVETLGLSSNAEDNEKPTVRYNRNRKVRPLSELSFSVLSKRMSKQELNSVYAEYVWPDRLNTWKTEPPFQCDTKVENESYTWFYKPYYSESRQQLEVKCIDSTHLLTRMRRKSCRGGLDGVSNEAWVKVAKSRKTLLTPIMVDEITDPMSVSMAVTHFSEAVELQMRANGDINSADLCNDIRRWWEAEDKAGIPAIERMRLRDCLRKRLLSRISFGRFPPESMFIYGWPWQLWEGLLANMDAKILLYSLCHGGSYNVRAFSSMIGETFFSELTLNDKRGQGTVSCEEFGQFIANTAEQVQVRLDPERTFSYCTTRSTMYRLVEDAENSNTDQDSECHVCQCPHSIPNNITFKNHQFDSVARTRLLGRKKESTVSTDRNSLMKGSLGVRWESARRNDSKLLLTKKMGIEDA